MGYERREKLNEQAGVPSCLSASTCRPDSSRSVRHCTSASAGWMPVELFLESIRSDAPANHTLIVDKPVRRESTNLAVALKSMTNTEA